MAKILLVDDNAELRRMMEATLSRAGHHVQAAPGGKEGIQLLKQQEFDLLITDIVMPEQDGFETVQIARKLRPALRILVMSGDSPRHAPLYLKTAAFLGAHQTLLKPFTVGDLAEAVKAALPEEKLPPG